MRETVVVFCDVTMYEGFHCWHWGYTNGPCCFCASVTDNDDDKCVGTLPPVERN